MIFYFTATGNSLYAAKSLDEELISIPQIMNSAALEFTAKKIGIVCPVYAHEMPAMVKEFIRKAVFHTDYLYAVLTYGAKRANAVELADRLFREANKKASYITSLLMVDNFLPVFDMNHEIELDKNTEAQLAKIREDIDSGKCALQKVSFRDRALHKMFLATLKKAPADLWANFIVNDSCIGCGICTKVCPSGCIRLENQRAVHLKKNCQVCFACIHACPELAIKTACREKNPNARYRNESISLSEIVAANNQMKN